MRRTRTRSTTVLALAMLGALAAVGVGYAAIPSSDGVIHSCYNASSNPSGQLRVIDAEGGVKCAKNEKSLAFNQRGPKGDAGPQGVPGKDGLDGAPGADGTAGLDGAPGADGKDGIDGAPGPAGPTDAYIGRNDLGAPIDNPGKTLVTLDLPAGFYAVFGKADVTNLDTDEQDARCTLSTGEYSEARIGHFMTLIETEGADRQEIVVQDLLTLGSPGAVTLACSTHHGSAARAKLTAIKVGALHG